MNRSAGFTTVELLVTILVTASFIVTISQLVGFISGIALQAHRQEVASNISYNNLRIYANGERATWFSCHGDAPGDTEATTKFNDGYKHPSAEGTVLMDTRSNTPLQDLPAPVIQKVTAVAPYGCGTTRENMPIRIVSKVLYGTPAKEMVHATYISQ